MIAVDLFSGAGGAALGLKAAGFEILAAVEIDPDAAATYERNIGVTPLVADIRTVDPDAWRERLGLAPGELDLMVGCPPCQGFTRLRGPKGASDPRNELVDVFARFVRSFLPKMVAFENVPGLIKSAHGRAYYERLVAALEAAGYEVTERVLDAADFGTPQHRPRLVVVSARGRKPLLPEPTHGAPDDPEVLSGRRKPWRTVRDAIAHFPPLAAGESCPDDPNHSASSIGPRVLQFIKMVPRDGGSRREVPREFWLPCHLAHDGHKDVFGRLAWDEPSSVVITSGCINPSKGRYVHPEQDRALTPREAAALQGFPDRYVFCGRRLSVASQIGNAFPPPLAEAVFRAAAAFLRRGVRVYARRSTRRGGGAAQIA